MNRWLFPSLAVTLCVLFASVQGCKHRSMCDDDETGVPSDLRSHFTSCLEEKLASSLMMWKYIVNYVVWDDMWYTASRTFFCKGKNATCWAKQASYFLKPTSIYLRAFKECIFEYEALNTPNTTIENTANFNETTTTKRTLVSSTEKDGEGVTVVNEVYSPPPCVTPEKSVYAPAIINVFTAMTKCPSSKYKYLSCMTSSVAAQKRLAKAKGGNYIIPQYNFVDLSKFIMEHRSNCRVVSFLGTKAFVYKCSAAPPPKNPQGGLIRTGRSISLEDFVNSTTGGRLNFRISSNGVARVLPSGPFFQNKPNAYKCFGMKLQTVLKAKTVLAYATSKCNNDERKSIAPNTRRVSVGFRVRETKKEPGQVGKCSSNDEWTPWYNRDSPEKGSGDLEYFSWIRNRHSRDVCFRPSAVQALLAKNNATYTSARQLVQISPTTGLSCYNFRQKNKKCEDYKIRFCCPKLNL